MKTLKSVANLLAFTLGCLVLIVVGFGLHYHVIDTRVVGVVKSECLKKPMPNLFDHLR